MTQWLKVTLTFECSCGGLHQVTYDSNNGDNLDYRPECGAYYKKAHRIHERTIVKEILETVYECNHCDMAILRGTGVKHNNYPDLHFCCVDCETNYEE